jgi:hypothetical protein
MLYSKMYSNVMNTIQEDVEKIPTSLKGNYVNIFLLEKKSEVPYFPVDNARVIYTKKYIERKKPMVMIHKVRVMQLKSKKFQIIYIPMYTII